MFHNGLGASSTQGQQSRNLPTTDELPAIMHGCVFSDRV